MESSTILAIFERCYTKSDAVLFINKLNTLSELLYNTKVDIAQKADELLTLDEKRTLVKVFKEQGIIGSDPTSFNPFLTKIKESLSKIPILSLQIAVEPTPSMVEELSSWLMYQLGQKYFLDIEVNPSLVAGAVVSVGGLIKDYTLKKKIEEKYGPLIL
jgi:F0F1-type ATP synthase delta subunit